MEQMQYTHPMHKTKFHNSQEVKVKLHLGGRCWLLVIWYYVSALYLLFQLGHLLLQGISLLTHLLVLSHVLLFGRGQRTFTFSFPLGFQLCLDE